ncbi:MAG: HPP family protein [Acutalibacteraceae bacterium]|nr:HPP family protein [Acutalibacteraceae bacterium]
MNHPRTWPSLALTALTATLMVVLATLLGEREVIFPEITAIAVGMLCAPAPVWNTSRPRILLTITACAFAGIGIVRFVPGPLLLRIGVGFALAICCIALSHTDFMPAVSACILPVVLGTRTLWYVASVVLMTTIILLLQWLLAGRKPLAYIPVQTDWKLRGKQLLAVLIVCGIPAMTGKIYFIVPPLIVAFLEMSKAGSRVNRPRAVALTILAAVVGAASRIGLTQTAGLPLWASCAVSVLLILLVMRQLGMWFPPAGAIATLPSLLLPTRELWLFPVEVAVGISTFALVAGVMFGKKGET